MRWLIWLIVCVCSVSPLFADNNILRLATTTSVENSGLLDYLLKDFHASCRCRVHVMPVGSGRAMEMGRRGDADLLITHAPSDEIQFVNEGYGINRQTIMYNSFVLLGPNVTITNEMVTVGVEKVMAMIADKKLPFLSRGDESGTHIKEKKLWELIQEEKKQVIDFSPKWYISAGIGMGQAIMMANELRAFVLSDIGTYLYFRDKIQMQVVVQDTPPLINPYSVIMVNPQRHSHVNHVVSKKFIRWITSDKIQQKIANYQLLGQPLFKVGVFPTVVL